MSSAKLKLHISIVLAVFKTLSCYIEIYIQTTGVTSQIMLVPRFRRLDISTAVCQVKSQYQQVSSGSKIFAF
jgi:hypothetical protein